MRRNEPRLFNRSDLLLLALPVVVAVALIAVSSKPSEDGIVEVYVNGKLVYDQPITHSATWAIVDKGKYLSTLVVDGKKKRVRVVDSTCPLKLCEHTGWIKVGGRIVCVPNKIVVKVEGKSDSSGVDIVTW